MFAPLCTRRTSSSSPPQLLLHSLIFDTKNAGHMSLDFQVHSLDRRVAVDFINFSAGFYHHTHTNKQQASSHTVSLFMAYIHIQTKSGMDTSNTTTKLQWWCTHLDHDRNPRSVLFARGTFDANTQAEPHVSRSRNDRGRHSKRDRPVQHKPHALTHAWRRFLRDSWLSSLRRDKGSFVSSSSIQRTRTQTPSRSSSGCNHLLSRCERVTKIVKIAVPSILSSLATAPSPALMRLCGFAFVVYTNTYMHRLPVSNEGHPRSK